MKLVILDRDGVINRESDAYIKALEEWQPIPGSLEAIARLNHAGFSITVATNQAGLARGLFDLGALEKIHRKMQSAVEQAGGTLAGVFYCPHGPTDGCDCRKPKPGLLYQIAAHFGVPLENVPVIGDSLRDMEAAWAVKARAILVLSGRGQNTLAQHPHLPNTEVHADLAAAADVLIRETGGRA